MLDVDLILQTSSIESFIALIKKCAPTVVAVNDNSGPLASYNRGESYMAQFDATLNGKPTLCVFQIQKTVQYHVASKPEVLQYLIRLGVPEADLSVLKKTTIKQLRAATHEQISEEEEITTVHTKNELGVYRFATIGGKAIKVAFDLACLSTGATRACITVDSGKEITDFTKQIRDAMPDGGIVVEDCGLTRNLHKH
jgi:hypothetical protein